MATCCQRRYWKLHRSWSWWSKCGRNFRWGWFWGEHIF